MSIALVHDHLAQLGGAEKTVRALCDLYPHAPLYTLLYHPRYREALFADTRVIPSFLQHVPGGIRRYQWYLPLMGSAIESLPLQDYDVVISSASSFAKGVITAPHAAHICYCHTPTRYLWHYNSMYTQELSVPGPARELLNVYISRLRQWDFSAAQRVDYFIANSRTVQRRIRKYYQRESIVIHPPVDTHLAAIAADTGDYFLAGGRLTPYKRFDIAINAFNKLGLPLKIFGTGPDRSRLEKIAGPTIEFLGAIPDPEKLALMARARAFIHPQEEDFGITKVEAMASGRPVIAYRGGGAGETIADGITGILFDEQTWEDLAEAVLAYLYVSERAFIPARIKEHAEQFSAARFKREFTRTVTTLAQEKMVRYQTS